MPARGDAASRLLDAYFDLYAQAHDLDLNVLASRVTSWYAYRMTTTQVAVRLPNDQLARIDRLVGVAHESRSEVIRRAVELYLYRLACEHDARAYEREPLSDAEIALADDPDAWKVTPAW